MTDKTITVHGARPQGMKAIHVPIDVTVSDGIGIHVIGLNDSDCKECLLRVMTALQSCGYRMRGKKIVITLNPVDMPKAGSLYDLPIALGLLAATGQEDLPELGRLIIMGELMLDGKVRGGFGAVQAAELARDEGFKGTILPTSSTPPLSVLGDISGAYGVLTLEEAIKIARGDNDAGSFLISGPNWHTGYNAIRELPAFDAFSGIAGHEREKRALEIAAAGNHNILLVTNGGMLDPEKLLETALHGILPRLDDNEFHEAEKVWSMEGSHIERDEIPWQQLYEFDTLGEIAGTYRDGCLVPGKLQLAHGGLLSIPDASLLPRCVYETLRGALEDGKMTMTRLREQAEYPAKFLLAAEVLKDRCKQLNMMLYDNIDIQIEVDSPIRSGCKAKRRESGSSVAARVAKARAVQAERYAGTGFRTNGELKPRDAETWCKMDAECGDTLVSLLTGMNLNARSYSKILKVARTIADLAGHEAIRKEDLAEAAGYRFLDRLAGGSNRQKRP